MPQPSTATVRPPASSAPWCAAASMPSARPLTTDRPERANAPEKAAALSRPPALGERLPTTATDGCQHSAGSPATNSASGGLGAVRSRAG